MISSNHSFVTYRETSYDLNQFHQVRRDDFIKTKIEQVIPNTSRENRE